jgi:N-acetylglucosaminyl-diphospho-decaprenol L-rhamnosyltransferase
VPNSIAIVILNYRTPELTLECLESLETEIDENTQVVIVDNASNDGSADRIERAIEQRTWSDWAKLVRAPANNGIAAGNNLGMRSVPADAYLLLQSDVRLQHGALRHLRSAMRTRPDAGVIGPALLDRRGRVEHSAFRNPAPQSEVLRAAHKGALGRRFERHQIVLPHSDRPFEPDWLAFACVLIRREVIHRVGLLDEAYFMCFEDVDFCRRARAGDFRVLYWPAAKATHLEGGTKTSADGAPRKRAPHEYYVARAHYFARFYGRVGLWQANLLWFLGRSLALPHELLGEVRPVHRKHEAFDIWTNAWRPLKLVRGSSVPQPPRARRESGEHEIALGVGTRNDNPRDIGLLSLIAEDFRTHDSRVFEPGLWAVVLHRLGNARMDVRPRLLRVPFSLGYRMAFTGVNWLWGIDLSYTVKLGRRVRIWHHGGIVLNAHSIGDDVHIRHNTTFGIVRRSEDDKKPRIGDRCDIGVGACVLGDVTVGDDCVIGANSVVLHDLPPGATAVGAPARPVHSSGPGPERDEAAEHRERERDRLTPLALHRHRPLRANMPRRTR